jgi:hypothetical protein
MVETAKTMRSRCEKEKKKKRDCTIRHTLTTALHKPASTAPLAVVKALVSS